MQTSYLVIILLFFAIGVRSEDEVKTMAENTVRAESGTCGDNLFWELNDEGTLTITGTGYMDNYNSTSKSPWSENTSSIKKVVIGEGVRSIGDYAFYICFYLTNVKIPDSLELIGKYAFDCSSIKSLKLGNGVKSIMDHAFYCCSSLVNISLGSSLETIGVNAFFGCSKLTLIEIEENNTAFSVINGVLFSDNNTVLFQCPPRKTGNYAIPDHVKKIGRSAFSECRLTNVIIPDSVTSIEDSSFEKCKNLVNLTLPDSIITIGGNAFFSCENLVNVKLSNKLERIEGSAFCYCPKMANVTIPKSVKYIGNMAFDTASSYMASIEVEDGNEYFKSIDGVLFNHDVSEVVQYPPGKTNVQNYVIPDSVKDIRYAAFENSQVINVTIPTGVKELSGRMFFDCKNLTCVLIPEGVQSIESQAFYNCENLGYITIPQSVRRIESYCFNGCTNLKSVFYQGKKPISSSTVLQSLPSLVDVCTPPDYTSNKFCGANVTPSSETCQMYQSFFTQCGRGSCIDGVVVELKWDNVTAWEQQTNGCEVYHCDGVNGSFVSWWNCNTSNDMRRVCVDGQCMKYETIDYSWSVELEMINLTLDEVDESNIMKILINLTEINNMKIGTEVDDKGNVVRIIVYVKDEKSATIVAEAIKKHDDEIFHKIVNVQVKCNGLWLSNGHQTVINVFMILFMMVIIRWL